MRPHGKFYVYEHWRPDTDVCFYVGKGARGRARRMKDRNPHHQAVVKKLSKLGMCVEIRMVHSGLTEDEAFAKEVERIAFWRGLGVSLVNRTNGGEGPSGLPSVGRKSEMHLETGIIYSSATEAAASLGVSVPGICDVCREKYRSLNGDHFVYGNHEIGGDQRAAMIRDIEDRLALRRRRVDVLQQSCRGVQNGMDDKGRSAAGPMKLARSVICLDDGEVFASASDAARKYSSSKSAIIELCLGKNGRKTVSGRRFAYVEVKL